MATETQQPDPPRESQPRPESTIGSDDLVERANYGDPVAVVELVRRVSALEPRRPQGAYPIRLHRPARRVLAAVDRRLCDVDAGLSRVFADLAGGNGRWPLFVYGSVGSGKTRAALAMSDLVTWASYTTLEWACDVTMTGGDPTPRQAAYGEEHCLLIVDEVGERIKDGDLQYMTLKRILDDREFYADRVGIYLSNLSPAELVRLFDDRIVSRLTCGTVFKLAGSDRRHGS